MPIIARRSGAVRVRDDVVTLTDVNAILLGPTGRQVLYYMTGTWSLPSLRREREAEHPHIIGFLQGTWTAFGGRL